MALRRSVIDIARRMAAEGLVRGTSGNVSLRDPESGEWAITPSGMRYDQLEPDDVPLFGADGRRLEGSRRPSVELPLHRGLLQARADVHGIVHTHASHATAFACCGLPIPLPSTELAAVLGAPVPVAPRQPSGSEALAQGVVAAMGSGWACLLENHGLVTVGRTGEEALGISLAVEEAARLIILAGSLRGLAALSTGSQQGPGIAPVGDPPIRWIDPAEAAEMHRAYRVHYGQPSVGLGQSGEPMVEAGRPTTAPNDRTDASR